MGGTCLMRGNGLSRRLVPVVDRFEANEGIAASLDAVTPTRVSALVSYRPALVPDGETAGTAICLRRLFDRCAHGLPF